MTDKKFIINVVILSILVVILAYLMVGFMLSQTLNKYEGSTELVGEEVIVKKDTLLIIRYEVWSDTYILENSVEVGRKLVVDNLLK